MNKDQEIVELSHGGGGKRMDYLIHFMIEHMGVDITSQVLIGPKGGDDGALIELEEETKRIVMTTDSHTIDPIFFSGGNIGDLAIAGTINDLVVMGAIPKYLTMGMIIEEGFKFEDLAKIAETIGDRLKETATTLVAGDTKVMPKGMLSNIIINTAGVGVVKDNIEIFDANANVGDVVIVTGTIGDHGTALMALREGIELETDLSSDVHPFWPYFSKIISTPGVHVMKDITRGGLASALNDIANSSNVCIEIDETAVPIKEEAQAICDILGLEILEISCEGKAVIIVEKKASNGIMAILREYDFTADATIIGIVVQSPEKRVHVKTEIGGTRILTKPYGEPIPRVC